MTADTDPLQSATDRSSSVPPAAQENIDALQDYQETELAEVSRSQEVIETVSMFLGSPTYFVAACTFIAGWIMANLWGWHEGWKHIDEPPFFWLQGLVSANALLLTIAVLIRQNRMSKLAARRAHLDLHVNLLTERKVSKVLEILQGLQKELSLPGHDTKEAQELVRAADPQAILRAIKQTEESAASEDGARTTGSAMYP